MKISEARRRLERAACSDGRARIGIKRSATAEALVKEIGGSA